MTNDEIIASVRDDEYEEDVLDQLHKHFEEVHKRWDWMEVADEGVRIYGVATGAEVEDWSFIYGLINAVAAQASGGTYEAVAAALGVNAEELSLVVSEWYENQDELPPPITYRTLAKRMKNVMKEIMEC